VGNGVNILAELPGFVVLDAVADEGRKQLDDDDDDDDDDEVYSHGTKGERTLGYLCNDRVTPARTCTCSQ